MDDTPAEDAVYWRLLDEVFNRCKSLGLEGIADDNHLLRQLPTLDKLPTPCLMVTQGRETIGGGGTNASDDIDYGVLVVMVAASKREVDGYAARYRRSFAWRERVRNEFLKSRIDLGVPGVCWLSTDVVDGEPLIPEQWRAQYLAQYWLLRVTMRENRSR